MLNFPFLPLLADGIGTFISLLFLFIAFIGWVMNLLSGKNQPAPPPGPRPRQQPRRDRRVQDEIEVFLRDVSQGRTPPTRPVEVVEEEEPALEIIEEHQPSLAELRQMRQREAASPDLSSELQEHLQNFLAREQQMSRAATANAPAIALGRTPGGAPKPQAAAEATPATSEVSAEELAALLRSPAGMRQGILMSEILGRPLSQRKS